MNIWRIELPSRFFVTRNDEPEHNIQQKTPASVQVSWERRSLAEVLVASIHVIDLRSVQGFYFEGHILPYFMRGKGIYYCFLSLG